MDNLKQILEDITLHDSILESVVIRGDGLVQLYIDFDKIWNKDLDSSISGIVIKSVYEISDFKLDRLNIIGEIVIQDIEDYNKEFIIQTEDKNKNAIKMIIEFVAGGSLIIICSGQAELLQTKKM